MRIFILDSLYPAVLRKVGPKLSSIEGESDVDTMLSQQGSGIGWALKREWASLSNQVEVCVGNNWYESQSWKRAPKYLRPFVEVAYANWQAIARVPLLGRLVLGGAFRELLCRVRDFKPDLIYVLDLNLLPGHLAKRISAISGALMGQIASPLPPESYTWPYDHVFSAMPTVLGELENRRISSSYLPLAFSLPPGLQINIPWESRSTDAVFIGSLGRHHSHSFELLKEIAKKVPSLQIYGKTTHRTLVRHNLESFYKGEAYGREMFEIYQKTKIVVNRHARFSGPYSDNMRMYEATGVGAALLTEKSRNIFDLFSPGEVLTYETNSEAASKVREMLASEEELKKVAMLGQAKTLKNHTYSSVAKNIIRVYKTLASDKSQT